jgi:hypothetical protein
MNKKFITLVYKLEEKIRRTGGRAKIRTYQHLPQLLSELQKEEEKTEQNKNKNKKQNKNKNKKQ